jgi:hypothetical protein
MIEAGRKTMEDKELAFEIAQKFIRLEAEIEAFRMVLKRHWTHPDSPWEPLVDKGKDQILNLETTHQRYAQLRSLFDAAIDGDSLIRTLHQELARRAKVS